VEAFFLDLVFDLELLVLLLLLVDFIAEDGIHLLALQELIDHLPNISISRSLLNLLESTFNSSVLGHFFLHLALKEL